MELYGRPIDARKVAVVIALLCAILIAALRLLPQGITGMLVVGALSFPVVFVLFDRPRILFYIFIFILFSNVDVYAPAPVFQPLIIFLTVALAAAVVRGRKIAAYNLPFAALVAAYLLLSFQSIAVARDLDSALEVFEKLTKLVVFLLLTSQFVNDRREFKRLLAVMAAGVAASNLLPFTGFLPADYAGPSLIGAQGVFRFQGLVFEPNAIAFWQIFCIPLFVFFIGTYRRRAPVVLLVTGLLLLSVTVIVLSFSRGAFVSFIVLFLSILYLERRNRVFLAVGLAIIAAAILLIPESYVVRVDSIIDALSDPAGDQPAYTRLVTTGVALKLGAGHLATGVGIGNFIHHAAHFTSYPLVVHNALLLIFSELGIFALGVVIAVIWCNMKILRRLMKRKDDREAPLLGRMLLLQHIGVLANSMFLPSSYDHIFWYTLALPVFAAYAYRAAGGMDSGRLSGAEGPPSYGAPGTPPRG